MNYSSCQKSLWKIKSCVAKDSTLQHSNFDNHAVVRFFSWHEEKKTINFSVDLQCTLLILLAVVLCMMEWARIERERERIRRECVCVAEALSAIINCIQCLPCAEWWWWRRGGARSAALRISTIQVSRPDHTKHVAAHVLWCQEKTHPVGRFPTSHRADPPQRRWMYNAVIFDLVKYVPHCCRRAAAPPRLQAMLCLMW